MAGMKFVKKVYADERVSEACDREREEYLNQSEEASEITRFLGAGE